MPGSFNYINVGSEETVTGIDSKQIAYQWGGSELPKWNQISNIQFKEMSISSDGNLNIGVDMSNNFKMYNNYHGNWQSMSNFKGQSVSAGARNNIWGISNGFAYYYYNGNWLNLGGPYTQIDASCDGMVWALDNKGNVFSGSIFFT